MTRASSGLSQVFVVCAATRLRSQQRASSLPLSAGSRWLPSKGAGSASAQTDTGTWPLGLGSENVLRDWRCHPRPGHKGCCCGKQNARSFWSVPPPICAAVEMEGLNPPLDSGTCPASLSPPPTLKRSRSPSIALSDNMSSDLPPAPQIDGEAMLEIFVHESIRFSGIPMNAESPYGDGKRLRTLGHAMLDAAYSSILFSERPMLSAEELQVCGTSVPICLPCSLGCRRRARTCMTWWKSG